MERRTLLLATGVSLVGLLAGCIGDDNPDHEDDIRVINIVEPDPTPVGETIEITVMVGNFADIGEGTGGVLFYIDDELWGETTVTVSGSFEGDDDLPSANVYFDIDTSEFDPGTYDLSAEAGDEPYSHNLPGSPYEPTATLTVTE